MKLLFFSLWKFAKFLMSSLKLQVRFPSNFTSIFSAIKHNSSVLFLVQALYALVKRSPLKCKFLRHLSVWVKVRQTVMSISKRQVISSSNFASFFIVLMNNSSVNFNLIYFLLWIKGSHQRPNFKTFECCCKTFAKFMMPFSKP